MKSASLFAARTFTVEPEAPVLQIRNGFEALIADIVAQCKGTPEEKREIAREIALAARIAKWDETELHFLLKKKQDPGVRNYTGFVRWACKIRRAS